MDWLPSIGQQSLCYSKSATTGQGPPSSTENEGLIHRCSSHKVKSSQGSQRDAMAASWLIRVISLSVHCQQHNGVEQVLLQTWVSQLHWAWAMLCQRSGYANLWVLHCRCRQEWEDVGLHVFWHECPVKYIVHLLEEVCIECMGHMCKHAIGLL